LIKSYYTNVEVLGSSVLVKEVGEDGVRRHFKTQWQPTIFIKDNSGAESDFKSLYGDNVKSIQPGNIRDTRDFVKKYDGVNGFEIFGQLNYALNFLNEQYPWDIDVSQVKLSTWSIDIETIVPETGFPSPKTVDGEIVLITLQNIRSGTCFTFGSKPYSGSDTRYMHAKDEYNLLKFFIEFWKRADIDIITGWNIETFDMPYIINRINRILGEGEANALSPWNKVSVDTMTVRGKEEIKVDILGVSILDYLALYKKFTYTKQESYSLKFIAQEELGHTKVELPGTSFNDNIDNHWDVFVQYNVIDTKLVTEMDNKLKLLELAITMAYKAKINFTDVFSPVKMWDALIHNKLLTEKVTVPQRQRVHSRHIEGAYVKEPLVGFYNWIVSLDATSLYPSIMMSLNISPETFSGRIPVTMEQVLDGSADFTDMATSQNLAISPIGAMFRREKKGILPRLIVDMMADRKRAKSEMLRLQGEYEQTKDASLIPRISALNNAQMAAKIALNSLYGATANEGFRFFNPDVAESITITGQFILKRIEESLDTVLNQKFKTFDHKYLVYVDTDSVYVNMKPVVERFLANKEPAEKVKSLEKVAVDILQEEINKICNRVSESLNFLENKIHFKLEAVGDKAIWVAKKKYVVRVHSSEGVTYAKPKMKVMGLEMVRSSTPAFIREKLREALPKIFDGTESETQEYISRVKNEFSSLPVAAQAFPRSANNLASYSDSSNIFSEGCPIQVRGALLYNHYLKQKRLDAKYPYIQEGDRIRFFYLKLPNPFKQNIIAIPADGVLPEEFGLEKYVDVDTQFDKSFVSAMKIILDPIGWTVEETSSLEDFFA
jgi:DNA polymerase elongation subunit (family B)